MKKRSFFLLLLILLFFVVGCRSENKRTKYKEPEVVESGQTNEENEVEEKDSTYDDGFIHVTRDTISKTIREYVEENLKSEDYYFENKIVNYGEELGINIIYTKYYPQKEYERQAKEIYGKIKWYLIKLYIDDGDSLLTTGIKVSFYLDKEPLQQIIKKKEVKRLKYEYKYPFYIGGFVVSQFGVKYSILDFKEIDNKESFISYYYY